MRRENITICDNDLPDDVVVDESVAIDTETMGLRFNRDPLCLVQLCLKNGNVFIIRISRPVSESNDSAPVLKKIMQDSSLLKIFHYARFDMLALKKNLSIDVCNVYCTKIASRIARTYSDRHGLKEICRELLGVDISKQQQSSDWGASRLSEAQILYAASDVVHLHALMTGLNKILIREGRADLAQECFSFLPTRVLLDFRGWDNEDIFSHSSTHAN